VPVPVRVSSTGSKRSVATSPPSTVSGALRAITGSVVTDTSGFRDSTRQASTPRAPPPPRFSTRASTGNGSPRNATGADVSAVTWRSESVSVSVPGDTATLFASSTSTVTFAGSTDAITRYAPAPRSPGSVRRQTVSSARPSGSVKLRVPIERSPASSVASRERKSSTGTGARNGASRVRRPRITSRSSPGPDDKVVATVTVKSGPVATPRGSRATLLPSFDSVICASASTIAPT
jgi:hypothetical protein